MSRIAVIGTGYVGLVSGACLADFGNYVMCVDVDAAKIERLKRGEIPIFEPGLDAVVTRTSAAGRLSFTTDSAAAVRESEVVFIAVGTPPAEDGSADLRHVEEAARDIARAMDGYMRRRTFVSSRLTMTGIPFRTSRSTEVSLTWSPWA